MYSNALSPRASIKSVTQCKAVCTKLLLRPLTGRFLGVDDEEENSDNGEVRFAAGATASDGQKEINVVEDAPQKIDMTGDKTLNIVEEVSSGKNMSVDSSSVENKDIADEGTQKVAEVDGDATPVEAMATDAGAEDKETVESDSIDASDEGEKEPSREVSGASDSDDKVDEILDQSDPTEVNPKDDVEYVDEMEPTGNATVTPDSHGEADESADPIEVYPNKTLVDIGEKEPSEEDTRENSESDEKPDEANSSDDKADGNPNERRHRR